MHTDTVTLREATAERSIVDALEVLHDPSGRLTAEEVHAGAGGVFGPLPLLEEAAFATGVLWTHVELLHAVDRSVGWIVEAGHHSFDTLDLFVAPLAFRGGSNDLEPLERLSHGPRSTFALHMEAGDALALYARVAAGPAPDDLPFVVWSPAAFDATTRSDQLVVGLLYGALVVMVLYNLGMYIALRDRTLVYYAGFVAALTLSHFVWDGLAREYLWPAAPHLNRAAMVALDGMTGLLAILFSRSYLLTPEHAPRLDRLLLGLGVLALAMIVLSVPTTWVWALWLGDLLAFAAPLALLATGLVCRHAGYRPARYYLIALSLLLVGLTVETVAPYLASGTPPEWTAYGTYAGSLAMVVLFSLGLADRYNEHIRARERVEAENRALQVYSYRDGLTGLWNRRAFDERLADEWRRAAREQSSLSLVFLDVDFFKKYNDVYGHPAGDACLRQVASAIDEAVRRPGDLVARYGGEEFVILLTSADVDGAGTVAESVRSAVRAREIPHTDSSVARHVTMSVGIATCVPQADTEPASLVAHADKALYAAKRAGRDRVVLLKSVQDGS